MSLKIARPWKDPEHGVYHLRQRTPSDLLPLLKGQTVKLPIGEAWVSVTVGAIVQASLRTKEPSVARVRHAIADGALKHFWHTHRTEGLSDIQARACVARVSFPQAIVSPAVAASSITPGLPKLTVGDLFGRWATDRADKRAPNTIKRYRGSIRSFEAFASGRDVRTLTGDDVYAWAVRRRDVEGISARAVNKNDLVAVSSIFRWGAGRASGQLLSTNPASAIALDEPRIIAQRERTFRDDEIAAILFAASTAKQDTRNPTRSASRQWCPWLAAYSGARIGELTSLEKRDVRIEGGIPIMHLRITKTGEPRIVPLHPHLIEQGYLAFVEASAPGPLFYDPKRHGNDSLTSPAEMQGHKVGKWVRAVANLDAGV